MHKQQITQKELEKAQIREFTYDHAKTIMMYLERLEHMVEQDNAPRAMERNIVSERIQGDLTLNLRVIKEQLSLFEEKFHDDDIEKEIVKDILAGFFGWYDNRTTKEPSVVDYMACEFMECLLRYRDKKIESRDEQKNISGMIECVRQRARNVNKPIIPELSNKESHDSPLSKYYYGVSAVGQRKEQINQNYEKKSSTAWARRDLL